MLIALAVWVIVLGYVLVFHGIMNFRNPGSLSLLTALTGKS